MCFNYVSVPLCKSGCLLTNVGTNADSLIFCCVNVLQAHVLYNSFYVFVRRDTKPNLHSTDKGTFAAARTKAAVRDADSAAAKPRASSPHGKRASLLPVREAGPQRLPKPLQTPSPVPSISPLLKRRKAEEGQTCPPARASIPTILVEDEPVETECGSDGRNKGSSARRKEGRVLQSKTGPGSPDKGKTPIKSVENI